MSRIIEGAQEALSIAKGEQPAASITVNGHKYVLASRISQQDSELGRMRRELAEAQEAILEGHLSAAIDDYNDVLAVLKWMAARDDRNGSLPEAYRKKIDEALAALRRDAGETRA